VIKLTLTATGATREVAIALALRALAKLTEDKGRVLTDVASMAGGAYGDLQTMQECVRDAMATVAKREQAKEGGGG
jgi:hypothetical protein